MKFYYNGKLVRTSKTMVYKYAIINTNNGKTVKCSKNMKGIEQGMSDLNENMRFYQKVKSMKDGSKAKKEAIEWIKKYQGFNTLDEAIEAHNKWIKRFVIVELEMRED